MIDLNRLTALAGQVKERTAAPRPSAAPRKPWDFKNIAADRAEVYIYDMIGDYGVTADDFQAQLSTLDARTLDVYINSEGGHVFDGIAIFSALKRYPGRTKAIVTSLAASAASFIALACDEVWMEPPARMMIHDAGIGGFYVEGNAAQMRAAIKDLEAMAGLLDSLSDTIAQIYSEKAGGTTADWRARMTERDCWFTAEQAVAEGLADGIVGQEAPQETTNRWDPIEFANQMKGVFA